jgi:hypothetical protein
MALPLRPPVLPQLARPRKSLPTGDGWVLLSPSGTASARWPSSTATDVYLQSRSGRPLSRYFPELKPSRPGRYVLDGEIVLFDAQGRPDFDALGQRIHRPPRAIQHARPRRHADALHRVRPARRDDESLLDLPAGERRARSSSSSTRRST